jgi:hypothetical protein
VASERRIGSDIAGRWVVRITRRQLIDDADVVARQLAALLG